LRQIRDCFVEGLKHVLQRIEYAPAYLEAVRVEHPGLMRSERGRATGGLSALEETARLVARQTSIRLSENVV